jgi:hypothetical protein
MVRNRDSPIHLWCVRKYEPHKVYGSAFTSSRCDAVSHVQRHYARLPDHAHMYYVNFVLPSSSFRLLSCIH